MIPSNDTNNNIPNGNSSGGLDAGTNSLYIQNHHNFNNHMNYNSGNSNCYANNGVIITK